jgi:hypothetical protein
VLRPPVQGTRLVTHISSSVYFWGHSKWCVNPYNQKDRHGLFDEAHGHVLRSEVYPEMRFQAGAARPPLCDGRASMIREQFSD